MYAYLGIAVEEIVEEGAEDLLKFGKRPAGTMPVLRFMKTPEWLQRLDAGTRAKVLEGYKQAKLKIGPKSPRLSKLLDSVNRSPFGKNFLKQLLTVESPVTVMLWTMYVYSSGNPLRATMNFASFMATSAASNALLATSTRMLAQAAIWAQRAKRFRTARAFLMLARLPKHPVIQLTAALGLALGLSPVIDKITGWVDEKIPDGKWKRGANNTIDIVSGSSIIDSGEFIGKDVLGLWNVDPELDAFSYLNRDVLYITGRGKINTLPDWNGAVDRAIDDEMNPLMQELHKLEYADGGSWKNRHAFELYGLVAHASELQSAIAAGLVEKNVISDLKDFDFLSIATSDSSKQRPDWAVKEAEDGGGKLGKAFEYLQGLDEENELAKIWKSFRQLVGRIAERVTTFRHLNLYDKKRWLEPRNGERMTQVVQDGLASEINYQLQRNAILKYEEGGTYTKGEFMRLVTNVEERRAHRDVPGKLPISDEKPWPNIFTDVGGWLERLAVHNDINQNTIDKVDRHFVEKMVGGMNAHTIQHENAFQFKKMQEEILAASKEKPKLAQFALTMAYIEALPDKILLDKMHTSSFWKQSYNATRASLDKEPDVRRKALLRESLLNTFTDYKGRGACGVPSISYHETLANSLKVSGGMRFTFNRRTRIWEVHTSAHSEMPYIAISGLGSRHHFPKINVSKKEPFSEWRRNHPDVAKKLAPSLLWHEKWVNILEERLQTANEAVEEKKQEEERNRIENIAPKEFNTALEAVKETPNSFVQISHSGIYLMFESDTGKYVTYRPPQYFDGAAFVSGDAKDVEKRSTNYIIEHSSAKGALYFYQHDSLEDSPYGYTWVKASSLKALKVKNETVDRMKFMRPRLIKPVTRNHHDVYRIIDLFTQYVYTPGLVSQIFYNKRHYGWELKNKLGDMYNEIPSDDLREDFLDEIFSDLVEREKVDENIDGLIPWYEKNQSQFGIE